MHLLHVYWNEAQESLSQGTFYIVENESNEAWMESLKSICRHIAKERKVALGPWSMEESKGLGK